MALLWLLILGLIIYFLARGHNKPQRPESTEYRLAQRNIEWTKFIAGYLKIAKTKPEKDLIGRMLSDVESQGLVATSWKMPEEAEVPAIQTAEQPAMAAAAAPVDYEPLSVPAPRKTDLDNISLLLYFGAFLFVASVGLFIVFGGANGAVRTIAVLLVMALLYATGIYLYVNKPKLAQAGLAFSGIGMTIAPLVGVAAYSYLFKQTHAQAIWFTTSMMCLAMYAHSLWVFRKPLVSYILIFTFLSLFESGISIMSAPIYYFGWAMAFVGILLSLASRLKGYWPELQESSQASSQLLLPLAVLASLILAPTRGVGQLGVSLLLAAAYYGLEALNTRDSDQQYNAITAHITALAGIACLSYSAGHSWRVVATTIVVANILQVVCVMLASPTSILWRNFASVLLVSTLTGLGLAASSPGLLLIATGVVVLTALVVWQRQRRVESYVLAALAWMALPVVFGQYYVAIRLEAFPQAVLLLSALLGQLGVYLLHKQRQPKDDFWILTAQQVYVFSAALVLVTALFTTPWTCLALALSIAATVILLAAHESDPDWAIVAGLIAVVPVLRAVDSHGPLLAAHLTALALNIFLVLWYRKEPNRWFSTALWLALPLSLGRGLLGGSWPTAGYAWAYFVVMLGLIFSRSIARGVIFMSSKISLSSYAKTASYSYVVGYWLAGVLAVGISLVSSNPRVHATCILGLVMAAVFVLSRYVEKRADMTLMLPLLAQAILWSAIRPVTGTNSMVIYLAAATALAVASYFVWPPSTDKKPEDDSATAMRAGALAAVLITPAAVLVVPQLLWPMPLGLFVAGALAYYHFRHTTQANRELAGAIMFGALLWFMWFAGIREVQAYTHAMVALLALYAYWRATRGETAQSDQYLMVMLATATIPLGLQAVSNQAGGLYGWWLLLEQVAFMLIGMAIRKRLVTLWGLYVAVGAVLYQLRNLGWAALTVLAMFLIGIAIYQLQRHTDKD